jgi:hypothetical protein
VSCYVGNDPYLINIDASVGIVTAFVYRGQVPRTDENGRHLGALLSYLLDGRVTNQQMHRALRMSSSAYYRRVKQDDFPNADELHRIADSFGLNFTDLQVRLGFVTRADIEGYVGSQHLSIASVAHGNLDVVSVD